MKFNFFVVVLLWGAVKTTNSEGNIPTRLGQAADEMERGTMNFVRRTKKQDNSKAVEDEGAADKVSSFTPNLRSFVVDDSAPWHHGHNAMSVARTGTIRIFLPRDTRPGDTVFLFLSRTGGFLPIRISNWKRGAECFKSHNRSPQCFRKTDCIERDGDFCRRFQRGDEEGSGKDLATVMFYRQVTADDPDYLTLEIGGRSPTWAIVTAIPNVNQYDPIRDVARTSCDVAFGSVFPSVEGSANDVLLLSQSFDDTALRSHFQPPQGTIRLGFSNGRDEAGFLFGKRLDQTGKTGELITEGPGGPKCKDALLSVIVNRN